MFMRQLIGKMNMCLGYICYSEDSTENFREYVCSLITHQGQTHQGKAEIFKKYMYSLVLKTSTHLVPQLYSIDINVDSTNKNG